jgi:hypothetical protein
MDFNLTHSQIIHNGQVQLCAGYDRLVIPPYYIDTLPTSAHCVENIMWNIIRGALMGYNFNKATGKEELLKLKLFIGVLKDCIIDRIKILP